MPRNNNYYEAIIGIDIVEASRSTRAYTELSGRTESLVSDVMVAIVDMGQNIDALVPYAKRLNKITLPTPSFLPRSSMSRILQAGEKKSLPSHIPEYYPPFPDPHTYIRTPTHKQPITEYEIIREKAATQKHDIERALTRYIAKTGPTNSLYPDDNSLFPLIACKTFPHPYIAALLFRDQLFDDDEPDTAAAAPSPPFPHEDSENQKDTNTDNDIMDNPYLRHAKLQKKRRK
nr:transcription initiation factor TFIID subunit 8 isoform X1 [Parasteatoda tepidariorum]